MTVTSALERAGGLDALVRPLQRAAQAIRPQWLRDALHGVWLGHPVHPALVQVPVGAWLSATVLGAGHGHEQAARRLTALGLLTAGPAAVTGATDWSELHEQQLRVGVVHAAANWLAVGCFCGSLASRRPALSQALRMAGLGAVSAGGLLGGYLSFRLASGANHAEAVPHLVPAGWHHLVVESDLAEGTPVRLMLGAVPVLAVRHNGRVHVLAAQCSHLSGPLDQGEISDGAITCPWHGSTFCLADGTVRRGPATAPQPAFEVRSVGGAIQVRLPGAG